MESGEKMLNDLKQIKLSGAAFDDQMILDFFKEKNDNKHINGVLLYGRNGSGKSTIAKAFRKLAGEDISTIDVNAEDGVGSSINLDTEDQKHLFVFDEDYVDKKVKFQEDHLDTIVMLGQAADLTEKISRAEIELTNLRRIFEEENTQREEYLNENHVKAPKYHLKKIADSLRQDDGWAGRGRIINDRRQNLAVRENTYKQFVDLKPQKDRIELISKYNDKIRELEDAKSGASVIENAVPDLPSVYKKYDDEYVRKLLEEVVEKPELSEREKKILLIVQQGKANDLLERLDAFQSSETDECPYCFQPLTQAYKQSLIHSIEIVLSKEVEQHQKNLKKFLLELADINLSFFESLPSYKKCAESLTALNSLIESNNTALQKKIDNPYEPVVINGGYIKKQAERVIEMFLGLEKERLEHNKLAEDTGRLIEELNTINAEIAYYDIKDLVDQYNKQNEEFQMEEKEWNRKKINYEQKKIEVEELEAQRRNVKLAIEAINASLKYIFFTENRLSIEYIDGKYKVLSNGKSVSPNNISVGERNIIGLSYFFTSILEGKDEENAYKQEYMIIIDDPISSYDLENKVGILSFLKYKLNCFMMENENTRVLIMTHDLQTAFDVKKIYDEIIKESVLKKNHDYKLVELRERTLVPFNYKARQEYSELAKIVYNYANGIDEEYDLIIGNIMRQLLEAYATFEYKKSIEKVTLDEEVLGLLPDQVFITYYKNLMYRLVLHGGSHREEQVKSMNDFDFFSVISIDEKQRTARDVLCFIYLLNGVHLLRHLDRCKDAKNQLEKWCKDIKKRAAEL